MEETILKFLLETPTIGVLLYVIWLKSKENKAMSKSIQELAAVVNKQSGVLMALTKEK